MTTPDPAIWVHCDQRGHTTQPNPDCMRCRDVATMNTQQINRLAIPVATSARFAELPATEQWRVLRALGVPLSDGELAVILGGGIR